MEQDARTAKPMDDFLALLLAVAAGAASLVLIKIGTFGLGLLGAGHPAGALGPTIQAVSAIGVGVLTYRRAIRPDREGAAL